MNLAAQGDGVPGGAIRALLQGAVDYAGVFPPAALPMADAVANYARHRAGAQRWMLGRLVIPVARLEELADAYAASGSPGGDGPWSVAAIARPSDAATLAAFNARYGARLRVEAVEVPPLAPTDLAAVEALTPTYVVYVEVDATSDPAPTLAALARMGVRAKIRTGGVTPDAFPMPAQVARFIAACAAAGVPFKATAGLHHAWRSEYPLTYDANSTSATMYGFANMLLAAAAARAGADEVEVEVILSARNGGGVTLGAGGIRLPSGRTLGGDALAAGRRAAMQSFGSCSFDEPVAELAELGVL